MRPTSRHPATPQPHATSIASEWGKMFLTQVVIGILLALLFSTLGLQ